MLLAAQLAAVTLQVVSVAGVLRHPVHLVAAVGAGHHPRGAALRYRDSTVHGGVRQGGGGQTQRRDSGCGSPTVCLLDGQMKVMVTAGLCPWQSLGVESPLKVYCNFNLERTSSRKEFIIMLEKDLAKCRVLTTLMAIGLTFPF